MASEDDPPRAGSGTRTDQASAFPPWWVVLGTAIAISVLTSTLVFLTGVGENVSNADQARQNRGITLMIIALLPAWLAHFFANHGHNPHRTVAYCLGVALSVVGVALAT